MMQRLQGPQRTAAYLGGVVVLMASLSFAAVPFYDWFCRVTGFGGTTGVAESAPDTILDQTVVVKFDASIERGMPWEFRPVQREMTVRIGENALAFYEAYNPTDRVVGGTASFNVAPEAAGGYFDKIACFCFTEQVLQPGERVEMPVSFFVDPEMVKDPEGKFVKEITLSYTFYEIDLPEEQAALAVPAGEAVN
jgi:cytochrome c oxidase assembly protein subunit 11